MKSSFQQKNLKQLYILKDHIEAKVAVGVNSNVFVMIDVHYIVSNTKNKKRKYLRL